jgi:hypothetical protein
LATQLGHLEATTIAVKVGFIMAILFVFPGMLLNPMFPIMGIFIILAGQQELAMLRYRQAHGRGEPLVEALPVDEEGFALARPASPGSAYPHHFRGLKRDQGGEVVVREKKEIVPLLAPPNFFTAPSLHHPSCQLTSLPLPAILAKGMIPVCGIGFQSCQVS